MRVISFAGQFNQLATYSVGFNAAPVPGGVASESLEELKTTTERRFPKAHVATQPFQSPTSFVITGDPTAVKQADDAVKAQFKKQGVHFEYQA